MLYIIVTALLLALIPASIAKNKGYSFGLWYLYGLLLWIVALIHSIILKDKTEEMEEEKIKEEKNEEEIIRLKKETVSSNRLLEIIELFNNGVLEKEEFIIQKDKMWLEIDKKLAKTKDLKIVKDASEKGILTKEEYNEIMEKTLTPTKIIKWIVKFHDSIIDHIEIEALENASEAEIEKIVRDKKYVSQIENIYPK